MKGNPANPRDWLQVAKCDLDTFRTIMASGSQHMAVFCLQQAAEKALKGWLIGQGWNLVKTHTLSLLQTEAGRRGLDLAWFTSTAERLTDLYFSDRYVDAASDPEPDAEEISQMYADVEKLIATLFPEN